MDYSCIRMRYFYCFLSCLAVFTVSLHGADPSATTPTRPAPRKPFVSKAATTASSRTSLPAAATQPASSSGGYTTSAPQLSGGNQAEIVWITRAHKAPSIRPAGTSQAQPIVPTTTTESTSVVTPGSGTQAQFGRIIERQ